MTNQENKIPIKGYATFDPLKHCWLGSGFQADWFADLPIYKNNKIMDPLKLIADETEEDYQKLEKILKDAGVKTYRSFLNKDKFKSLKNIWRPPVNPRDHFAVIGEKIYAVSNGVPGYSDVLKQIDRKSMEIVNTDGVITTANICRVGKDIYWDIHKSTAQDIVNKYKRLTWLHSFIRRHTGLQDGIPRMGRVVSTRSKLGQS